MMGGPEPTDSGRLNMVRYTQMSPCVLILFSLTCRIFLSIHFGVTQGTVKMDFGQSECVVFKNHIQPAFGQFMKKCFSTYFNSTITTFVLTFCIAVDNCRAMALPADHEEIALSTIAAEEDLDVHCFDHDVHQASLKATLTCAHSLSKAKEHTPRDLHPALGSKAYSPTGTVQKSTEPVKYGPPKGNKKKAPRVAPVGVAKDKILEPLPKPPALAALAATLQPASTSVPEPEPSNQDVSCEAMPNPLPKPTAPMQSPAPMPPPSCPSTPRPSHLSTPQPSCPSTPRPLHLSTPTPLHLSTPPASHSSTPPPHGKQHGSTKKPGSGVMGTADTLEPQQNGAHLNTPGPASTARDGVDKNTVDGVSNLGHKVSILSSQLGPVCLIWSSLNRIPLLILKMRWVGLLPPRSTLPLVLPAP